MAWQQPERSMVYKLGHFYRCTESSDSCKMWLSAVFRGGDIERETWPGNDFNQIDWHYPYTLERIATIITWSINWISLMRNIYETISGPPLRMPLINSFLFPFWAAAAAIASFRTLVVASLVSLPAHPTRMKVNGCQTTTTSDWDWETTRGTHAAPGSFTHYRMVDDGQSSPVA